MAERDSGTRDLLREHWRSRRDRILSELRGMESGSRVLPNSPAGEDVRSILQDKTDKLRAELQRLNENLGLHDVSSETKS